MRQHSEMNEEKSGSIRVTAEREESTHFLILIFCVAVLTCASDREHTLRKMVSPF